MPSDFDQQLYDDILEEMMITDGANPHHSLDWSEGARWTAIAAARLAASRQPSAVSDEFLESLTTDEIRQIIRDCDYWEKRYDELSALQTPVHVPEIAIPEGWRLSNIVFIGWDDEYADHYRARLTKDTHPEPGVTGTGPTWQAALAAACQQAQGGGK